MTVYCYYNTVGRFARFSDLIEFLYYYISNLFDKNILKKF